MIAQTVQFMGQSAGRLYDAYLSSAEHAAMTIDGSQAATFHRHGVGDVDRGELGDELRAFGMPDADGVVQYALRARTLALVPGREIVMSWKNKAWNLAVDADEITDLASIVVLTFVDNFAGAEIRLSQVNVPRYRVHIPDTGETGSLHDIVNTHWSLLYWEPMRGYFAVTART
jgi:hypothetical protein